jgi:hypothetical protein
MMRDGVLWERTTLGLPTSATESGLWPTPCLPGNGGTNGKAKLKAMLWPTIRAADGERGGRGDLIQAIRGNENSHYKLWPTPCASEARQGYQNRNNGKKGSQKSLTTVVVDAQKEKFATPTKADAQGGPGRSDKRTGGDNLRTQVGGQLNPTWVEWLMGWPLGWTDCASSGTDKFRQWLHSHGVS